MLRTKVVCTLGPSTSSPETLGELVAAGLDMARINMSHGTHQEHASALRHVREAAERQGRPLSVLVDLAGPKIRVGDLSEPRRLERGSVVRLSGSAQAEGDVISVGYAHLADDLESGSRVLLDDGNLELECLGVDGDVVRLRVVRGGLLKSRKGVNLPGIPVKTPSLTKKDLRDLEWALEMGAEYVGLSFVRTATDVRDLKERLDGKALVVAKIEKAQALDDIRGILEVTDAVMVARGDLGVELPFEKVPMAQKRIIQLANLYARPVITATQMLESMIDFPRPTRAEASDVANAILDGTDAVMLSGETAVGRYPVEAVEAIGRIATEIEGTGVLKRGPRYVWKSKHELRSGASKKEHAVASATVSSVRQLGSPAVIVITRSGFTARLVSSYRPPVPIFAVCTDQRTCLQLAPVWGIRPVLAESEDVSYEALTDFGRRHVLEQGVGEAGQTVPVTAGYPFHTSGSTNTMRLEQL